MVAPELLKDVPFFEELPNNMLERLAAIAEIKTYPKDHYLDKTRTSANNFYLVLDGEISLQMDSVTGKTIRLETISHGGAIGFSSLIDMDPKRYTSDAKTLTPVKLLRFKADEMMLLFHQDFELGYLIMKKIAWIAKRRLMHRTRPIPKL
jgi:CRP-like cAMP-binding protein